MEKKGIVIKLSGKYLDVLEKENANCCSAMGNYENVHDCSSCSGCSSFNKTKLKTIRVVNKSGKNINVGDEISFSFNFLVLQFFVVVLLPILAFGLSFFSFYVYSFSEASCILFSFLIFLFIICVNSFFTKKLFMPFV